MIDRTLYEGMTKQELIERLEAAEKACLMYGWSPMREHTSDASKATYRMWLKWMEIVGADFLLPDLHPELGNATMFSLARQYDKEGHQIFEAVKEFNKNSKRDSKNRSQRDGAI